MSPDALRSKIHSVAQKLTAEIVAVFGDAFVEAASEFTTSHKPAAPRKAVRKPRTPRVDKTPKANEPARKAMKKMARRVSSPKPAGAKRARRSGGAIMADGERVVKLLAANKKGLRIEQINKQLGTSTKQLVRPISKLLAAGKIKKAGERRGTLYFQR